MIPILYESTETDFTSNGIGRLRDCISCLVTEERNGAYEVEMVYPVGGWLFDQLVPGKLIGVIHDDDHDIQPFEIYSSTAEIETVTFYARHISYRLSDILVAPFTASGIVATLAAIASNSVNTNPFTLWTDKTSSGDYTISIPQSARSSLFGSEGSVLDVFGGEFEFDVWDVKIHASRGSDTGVTVRYGKNMLGLEQEIDGSELFNAVAPYYVSGDTKVLLSDYYVQPTTPPSQPLKIRAMDFTSYFTAAPSESDLRSTAKAWIDANKPWIPSENLTVDFVAMWQTEEYKNLAEIQRVRLCDTVSVYYTDLGIVAEKQKVVKTVFDVLKERFDEIELGTLSDQFVAITGGTSGGENPYIIEEVAAPQTTLSANQNYSGNVSAAKSGYRPIAIAGFTTSSPACVTCRMDLDVGAATVYFNVRNVSSSAATPTPKVRVVYVKN